MRYTLDQKEPSRCTECTRQPPTEKRVVHTCSILGWLSGSGPGAVVACSADGVARWLIRRPDFVQVECPVWMFTCTVSHYTTLHDRSLEGMYLLSLPLLSYRPYQTIAILVASSQDALVAQFAFGVILPSLIKGLTGTTARKETDRRRYNRKSARIRWLQTRLATICLPSCNFAYRTT